MAALTYKQILKNMIQNYLYRFVRNRNDTFPTITDIVLEKNDEETIMFSANVEVDYNTFDVHGGMDQDGDIIVTSITYDGMRCTEKDENGWWITESAKPFHRFIFGEALKDFDFTIK